MEVHQPVDFESGELRCPRCFHKDIVHSLEKGIVDRIMRRYGRVPRHCRFCGKRFYAVAAHPPRDRKA